MLVLDVLGIYSFGTVSGIAHLVLAFLYNKFYLQDRVDEGWIPCDSVSKGVMLSRGIAFSDNY